MAELVDARDSNSRIERCRGSSPLSGTTTKFMKHFFVLLIISFAHSQNCEIKNLFIKLPNKTQNVFEKNLKIAYENFNQNPNSDNLIWIGRRHAYLGNYESAIKYFSQGISTYPLDLSLIHI